MSILGRVLRSLLHRLVVLAGASGLTVLLFLVLPLMQSIAKPPEADLVIQAMEVANLPPPPEPMEEEEPEPEEEEPEEPPELDEDPPLLDLADLELALDPSFGDGWMGADFAVKLQTLGGSGSAKDALFNEGDLDQKPRVIHQAMPILSAKLRKLGGGTVRVVFDVDEQGKVQNPRVLSSPNPAYERPALAAVKKWRFEPGKRKGKPVRYPQMKVPITFPGG